MTMSYSWLRGFFEGDGGLTYKSIKNKKINYELLRNKVREIKDDQYKEVICKC